MSARILERVTVYHLFSRDRRPVQYIEAVRWELG